MTMRTEETLMVKHVPANKAEREANPERSMGSSMEINSLRVCRKSRNNIGATSTKQKRKAKWTLRNARKYEQFLPLPRNGRASCANAQQCGIKKEYFGEQIFNVSSTCECLWRPYWVCYFVDVCVTGSKVCLTQGCATKDGNGGTQNTTTHTSIPCWHRSLSLPHRLAKQ